MLVVFLCMWNLWLGSRLDRRGLNYIESSCFHNQMQGMVKKSKTPCRCLWTLFSHLDVLFLTFLMIKIFQIFNKDSRAGKMAPVEGVRHQEGGEKWHQYQQQDWQKLQRNVVFIFFEKNFGFLLESLQLFYNDLENRRESTPILAMVVTMRVTLQGLFIAPKRITIHVKIWLMSCFWNQPT